MAILSPQTVAVAGLNATYVAAAAGGDTVAPAAGLVLHVKNGDAAPNTVTLVRPGAQYGQPNPDVSITVAAGGAQFIRVPPEFADSSDQLIDVTYSAVTAVTVALLKTQ